MEGNYTYYQYHRDQKYPLYLKVQVNQFDPNLPNLLKQLQFSILDEDEVKKLDEVFESEPHARMLTIKLATNRVARHVDFAVESDRYGFESVMPKDGYRLYRYKGMGLMVYSFVMPYWELGVHSKFGAEEELFVTRMMINRFLAWGLFPFHVVGVWGVPVDEGIVVLRPKESKGEAVFIDLKDYKVLSEDGASSFPSRFKVLRLDSTLRDRNISMNDGQLSSFLASQTTFMDSSGLNIPVRQMIKTLSQLAEGIVHPRDLFRPRTELNP